MMGEPSTSTLASTSASASASAAVPTPDAFEHRHPHEHRNCTPRPQLICIRIASGEDPEYVVNLDDRRPVIVAAMRDVEEERHDTALRCLQDRTISTAAAEGTLGGDSMESSVALHCAVILTLMEHLRKQPESTSEAELDSPAIMLDDSSDGDFDVMDELDGEIDALDTELDAMNAELDAPEFEIEALEFELDLMACQLPPDPQLPCEHHPGPCKRRQRPCFRHPLPRDRRMAARNRVARAPRKSF